MTSYAAARPPGIALDLVAAEAWDAAVTTSAAISASFDAVSIVMSPEKFGRVDRNVRSANTQVIADRRGLFPSGLVRGSDPDNVAINVM